MWIWRVREWWGVRRRGGAASTSSGPERAGMPTEEAVVHNGCNFTPHYIMALSHKIAFI
jgi:hypothetical protein